MQETQGVNVVTLGQSNFPAFFVSDSGHLSPLRLDTIEEIAEMILISHKLGLKNGNLIAIPVSSNESADFQMIETATKQALSELTKFNIKGRDVTPYLLQRVNELTNGRSLKSNIALIKNNAKHGAMLAKTLKKITIANETKLESINIKNRAETDLTATNPLVIGGVCNDVIATVDASIDLQLKTSNPGIVKYSEGGVGRNIAECLGKLGFKPKLLSVVGNDIGGQSILNKCENLNIDVRFVLKSKEYPTSSYIALHNNKGDLHCAVADFTGLENCLTVDYVCFYFVLFIIDLLSFCLVALILNIFCLFENVIV